MDKPTVTYLVPMKAYQIIKSFIESSSKYKRKQVWLQKFVHLFDYIQEQNHCHELNPEKEYVNIHQGSMAKILGVDNRQMSGMLKDAIKASILKCDGKMSIAQKIKNGRKIEYLKPGKSYGYQFVNSEDLEMIEIEDKGKLHERSIEKKRKEISQDEKLKKYQEVLSKITVDSKGLENSIKLIIEGKKKKEIEKRKYKEFIKNRETEYRKINKESIVIPFDGVIHRSETAFKVQKRQPTLFVENGHFEVKISREDQVILKQMESDATTIARCVKSVYDINAGLVIASRPIPGSRIYCIITNLKRELRKHLRLNGKKLLAIDIRNSQPLIACILIRKYWLDRQADLPPDVLEYQKTCEGGLFYDDFMEELKLSQELRSEFKKDFFRQVFFSKVIEKGNILKDMFIRKYPNVWEMICDEKGGLYCKNYNKFAQKLQKVESMIIFDIVNMQLIEQGIDAFNIFDAIYVNSEEDYKVAKQLLQQTFNQLGINPTFNMEEY